MKLSYAVSFVCGAAAAMIAFTTIGGPVYEPRTYHVNAGKIDALNAPFRDHVDRPEELDRENLSQTDSLQSIPERRALRRLGATRAFHARAARCIQVSSLVRRSYT
jgi:hypothetical protein